MKMTAEAAERQAEQSAANPNTMSSVIDEVYGDRSRAQLSIEKPQNTCILDKSGFIACGPIVGYERPAEPTDKPWILDGKPTKPIDDLLNGGKPTKPMDDRSGGKPSKPAVDEWIYDLDRPTRK